MVLFSVYTASSLLRNARQHWKDEKGKIVVVIAAGWFLSIGIRNTFPVLLPYLQSAYGLTLSTAGLLLTVLWLTYALGQLPGGLLGDRIGEGVTLSVSLLAGAATLVLVVVGGSAFMIFFSTALLGFALAFFGTVRLSVLSDTYPNHRGTAIGLISAGGDLGNTVLPPIAGLIAATIAWQLGFGFVIPLFLIIGICVWVIVPARTAESRDSATSLSFEEAQNIFSAISRPSVTIILVIQILSVSINRAFTGFYPIYLVEIKGMSATVAASLFSLFFALGIIIKPLSGNAFDRIGARQTLVILLIISGVGLALLPLIEGFWALVAVTALVSFMGGRGTIALSYMTTVLPKDVLNSGLGTLRTIYMVIGAGSPVLFGMVADYGFFDEAFLLLALITGICLVLIWKLPEV